MSDLTISKDSLRVPPHSLEAEQSVLGGLLLENSKWDDVADILVEADFYRLEHKLIFRAIADLVEKGKPFDVITLSEWLQERGELEKVGGLAYMGLLANETPTAANIVAYADIVRQKGILRRLIDASSDIATRAYSPQGQPPKEVLDFAEQRIFEIAEQGIVQQRGFQSIKKLLTEAVNKVAILFEQGDSITGVATGFTEFDKKTSGLQPGDLLIVAGRPGMGKTTFAMNVAENAAIGSKVPVAVFSMEMPGEQLARRIMSSIGRIDQHRIRTGQLEDDDWPRITSATAILAEAPLYIDDSPALSPTDLRAKARRLARECGGQLGLIVIDYLQLMQVPALKENRTAEISEISRSLKALAKELSVPVIALSQLNRSVEQRPDKRPRSSDLRESGSIEQDADMIVFVYRDEYYHEDSPDKGIAEVIIGKQRNGPTGTVRLSFQGQFTRFDNLAPDYYQNQVEEY